MRELTVFLHFSPTDRVEVGTLAERGRARWFQYAPSFLPRGLELSPLRLPLSHSGLLAHNVRPGVPLPGLFNDSRPDGWGLKLLHRAFQAQGRAASSVSPLEELAYLGDRTMGALTYHPSAGPQPELDQALSLNALATEAQRVWDDRVEHVLPSLIRAGGPSGGARPKALIALPTSGLPGVRHGDGDLPEGWQPWIIKFPTSTDDPDVGRREAAWMAMAQAAGLIVPSYRTISLDNAAEAFAAARFDRPTPKPRLHMLSAAGAFDVDFRTAAADYEHLLRATTQLCQADQSQTLAMFRLAAFNLASCNQDDHLKNFSWLMGQDGVWRLAPAYDLTYAPSPSGEHTTTLAGQGRGHTAALLQTLAVKVGIQPRLARDILAQVTAATAAVHDHLDRANCSSPVSVAAAAAVREATGRLTPA